MLSFGERRELHLRPKAGGDALPFVMEPGSLFILGPLTNEAYEHSLVPVADERLLHRDPERPVGARVSLVMRDIATVFTSEQVRDRIRKCEVAKVARDEKKRELKSQPRAPAAKKSKADGNGGN